MVNIEKHREMREMKIKNDFKNWLFKYGVNQQEEAFDAYYAGLNSAIIKKQVFDNSMSFPRYRTSILTEDDKKREELLSRTKSFLKEFKVNPLIVDAKQQIINKFDIFQIFDKAKQYDILFIKNVDLYLEKFFLSFGIEEYVDFIYFFPNSNVAKQKKEKYIYHNQNINRVFWASAQDLDLDLLFKKYHMTGFELYDHLKEWKKEVSAPTRNSPEYKKMKKRVRQRDGNTCQCCGYHSSKKTHHHLEVHHIYGYKDHLDYRVEDSNCITLCSECHKKYHSLYGKKNITPFTFIQFIKEYHDYYNTDFQTTFDNLEVK